MAGLEASGPAGGRPAVPPGAAPFAVVPSRAGIHRRARRRSWRRRARRVLPPQGWLLLLFAALIGGWATLARWSPDHMPLSAAMLVVLLGGFFLRLRALTALLVVVAAAVAWALPAYTAPEYQAPPVIGPLLIVAVTSAMVVVYVRSRQRLGVQGTTGESMLVDLRDRLRAQGEVPVLPPGWHVETVLRSAYGDSFSGDFLVSCRSDRGRCLETVLVDVSGKGQAAGTRALLLSGAFGGLLGALAPEAFLPVANEYLLRQGWVEGFATAVHLAVNLEDGTFRVASAGHPPVAHYHAGSGQWEVLRGARGPALGILERPEFPAEHGSLERGDALLLYTDGLVETPGGDLDLGIDRLMGQAERLVSRGFAGGASRVVDGTRAGENDDRALVLLWRSQ